MTDATSASPGYQISVLIVEDHPALRDGLRLLLGARGFRVAGTAGTADEAAALVERRMPDVVLLDIALPGADGIELAERLLDRSAARRILLYTASEDAVVLRRALNCGAAGIASKERSFSDLATAIRIVAAGDTYLDPGLMLLIEDKSGESAAGVLSPRQREVVELVASGRTSAEVAADLVISPLTAETHVRNAMANLGAHTRAHAVAEAFRRHEIEL